MLGWMSIRNSTHFVVIVMTGIRLSGYIPVRVSTNGIVAKVEIPKRGTAAFSNADNKKKIEDGLPELEKVRPRSIPV